MKIFVTHNPEDREMYFHWAMDPLGKLGEVVLNPTERNLTTEELIESAAGWKRANILWHRIMNTTGIGGRSWQSWRLPTIYTAFTA